MKPEQGGYQELQSPVIANSTPPLSQYQPLSAEEEQKTTVVDEPEESAGFTVVNLCYDYILII